MENTFCVLLLLSRPWFVHSLQNNNLPYAFNNEQTQKSQRKKRYAC